MIDFVKARRNMVDCQVRPSDVTDHAVLAAFDKVERERFLPDEAKPIAYLDRQLPVGGGRVLLAPMVLARLVQALQPRKTEKAVDLACGLGYSTALLAELTESVVGVEASQALANEAQARLSAQGVANAKVIVAPLANPPAQGGPADVMLVNGLVEVAPTSWLEAIADGGRVACVKLEGGSGRAVLLTRIGAEFSEQILFDATAPALPEFQRKPEFAF